MKPVSVRFRCFGPYIQEQTIRFDELEKDGLFLICGETGSGKTTILDAMCCALYGSCSGDIRGELESMRCKQADSGNPTEVDFVFESGGKKYRFARKLTPRKSRSANAEISYNEDFACQTDADGIWVPLLDNCKKKSMNAKAAELLGLDLNQFRQVIILPQGKFETLLTSKSEDKEGILSSLFHTQKWKATVDRMAEELNSRREAISREIQTIQDGLKRLDAATMEELPDAVNKVEADMIAASDAEGEAEKAKKRAKEFVDLSDEYVELDKRTKRLEEAKKAAEDDDKLQDRLNMAIRAEKTRQAYNEWQQAKKVLTDAENLLKETEEQLELAKTALQRAQTEKDEHESGNEGQEIRKNESNRLSALRDRYVNLDALQKTAEDARKYMNAALKEADSARDKLADETEKLKQMENAWNDAMDEYRQIAAAYQAVAAGHLALSLQEGQACPVCGSRHHPCLAILPEGAVGSNDVDAAEEKQHRAKKQYDDQKSLKDEQERKKNEAEREYGDRKAAFDAADGALRNERAQVDPELESLKALDQRKQELDTAIQDFAEQTEALNKAYNQADVHFRTLTGNLKDREGQKETAWKGLAEKETAWQKTLIEAGLGTTEQYLAMILSVDEQDKLRKELSDHSSAIEAAQKNLQEQQEKLEGTERPDAEKVTAAYQEAEKKHKDAIQASTLATRKWETMKDEAERLKKLDEQISDKRTAYEADNEFVRALRGSTGMSIHRYVLSVRLDQVITEANRLLAGIYGGRYRLHRSDTSYGSSHKSGLELEVYDSMNDQHRSVCTLSGGEKFLVALSLAIGLRTVVQNEQRGVTLDAMFIDEGFGTLDQSALNDALDVLQAVRNGRGLVGIISHVSLLEEIIPTQIKIKKTANGSEIN